MQSGERSNGACTGPNILGTCSCPPDAAPSPSCVFYSPRIQGSLVGQKSEFDTASDHWTATVHWTVVDPDSEAEGDRIADENCRYFDEVLVNHSEWAAFFTKFEDVEVGAKVGDGGQAEIFAVARKFFKSYRNRGRGNPLKSYGDRVRKLLAKAWKAGVSVKDLEIQWPPQMAKRTEFPFRNVYGGTFFRDGKFKNRFGSDQ